MTHHICTGGCEGVSETPGTCGTETCPLHGQPLQECSCEDSLHAEVLKKDENAPTEDSVGESE